MLEEAIDGKGFIGWKEGLIINWNIQKNGTHQPLGSNRIVDSNLSGSSVIEGIRSRQGCGCSRHMLWLPQRR